MVLSGDECRRTQHGNNNAYCQDNEISWFDWDKVEQNADLLRFFRGLTAFRRRQPSIRRKYFLTGAPTSGRELPDVNWYSALGTAVDWNGGDRALACLLLAPCLAQDPEQVGRNLLMLFNPTTERQTFIIPTVAKSMTWRLFVDTAAVPPEDIYPRGDGPSIPFNGKIILPERSMRCFVQHRNEKLN